MEETFTLEWRYPMYPGLRAVLSNPKKYARYVFSYLFDGVPFEVCCGAKSTLRLRVHGLQPPKTKEEVTLFSNGEAEVRLGWLGFAGNISQTQLPIQNTLKQISSECDCCVHYIWERGYVDITIYNYQLSTVGFQMPPPDYFREQLQRYFSLAKS